MPPKKRKTADNIQEETGKTSVWLLTFVYMAGNDRELQVFSSKERAIAAMPKLMDEHCPHGIDWRNGLKGFGKRNEDNYLHYEYFGDDTAGNDGVLISNEDSDGYDRISVYLEELELDPSDAGHELREEGRSSGDSDEENSGSDEENSSQDDGYGVAF
jgi:hypothetical protein